MIIGAKMAAKEYNAEISVLAPSEENDVKRQNELLEEAIQNEPDAILFSPSSFTDSDELLKRQKIWESGSVLLIPIQKKKSRI